MKGLEPSEKSAVQMQCGYQLSYDPIKLTRERRGEYLESILSDLNRLP